MRSLVLVCVIVAAATAVPVNQQALRKPPAHHDSRIINGVPAANNTEFPYQVGFDNFVGNALHFCGGSLIGDKWILTSARCVSRSDNLLVYLNSIELGLGSHLEDGDLEVLSLAEHIHPDYNNVTSENDIAIIELPIQVNFTDSLRRIRLATADERIGGGVNVTISGWGGTTELEKLSHTLNSGTLTTITNQNCLESYTNIQASNLCAFRNSSQAACTGDLGGPLVATDAAGERYQVGVFSWHSSEGCNGHPGVYTRPESYLPWINNITGLNF